MFQMTLKNRDLNDLEKIFQLMFWERKAKLNCYALPRWQLTNIRFEEVADKLYKPEHLEPQR